MSSWYRTLDAGMWGDDKFRRLTRPGPSAQFLWIYILTGEHTDGLPGLYRVGEAALAEALGWSLDELRPAFAELVTFHMALADWNARVIYLPNALRYQGPMNPKHLQSLEKTFRRIPECDLKEQWLQDLTDFAAKRGEPYTKALHAAFDTVCDRVSDRVSPPNPNPNPNSNPHPHNLKPELPGNSGVPPLDGEAIPYQEIIDHLNQRSGKRYRHGTEATRRHIRARWNEGHRVEDFRRVVDAKCVQWRGTDFEKYLRPQTIFGPKFEGYLNEQSDGRSDGSLYPDMDQLMEHDHEA